MTKKRNTFAALSGFLGFVLVTVCTLNAADYNYVASKFSIKYHLPNCKQVRGLQEQNRVVFEKAEEAVSAGFVPCRVCMPPTIEGNPKK